jgi:hypothetical protein
LGSSMRTSPASIRYAQSPASPAAHTHTHIVQSRQWQILQGSVHTRGWVRYELWRRTGQEELIERREAMESEAAHDVGHERDVRTTVEAREQIHREHELTAVVQAQLLAERNREVLWRGGRERAQGRIRREAAGCGGTPMGAGGGGTRSGCGERR